MENFNSVRLIRRITAILGASDPEMEMIENLLRECGVTVIHALNERGERVRPNEAYRAAIPDVGDAEEVWAVECIDTLPEGWIRIDHHRPGDPGHGLGPEDFLKASSIGQVIALLGRLDALPAAWARVKRKADADQSFDLVFEHRAKEDISLDIANSNEFAIIPMDYVLCAAADHCLAHAYTGRCLGVTFDALLDWRLASKAKFQNCPEGTL